MPSASPIDRASEYTPVGGKLTDVSDVVYWCDALALLRALPDASVDAVITDPPYGLARGGRNALEFPHKKYAAINETWDIDAPLQWMQECSRILKPGGSVICFGVRQSIYEFAHEGMRLGWRIVNDITWVKPNAPPNFTGRMMAETTERILWFCPDGKDWTYNLDRAKYFGVTGNLRDVWTFNTVNNGSNPGTRVHPAQKPLELMRWLIEILSNPGDLILDPFLGSGTTAIAARNTGRRFIGCDITREYVELARRRLAQPYTVPMFE